MEAAQDLRPLREEIDAIDRQIVSLYERRMEASAAIAEIKRKNGGSVYDPVREAEKLESIRTMTKSEQNRIGLRELFEQIMSASRKLQYRLLSEKEGAVHTAFLPLERLETADARVVYQGAEGSYSEAAMKAFFGEDVTCFSVPAFRDAMTAIEEGSADFGILPIENSTAGVVSEIYDLLAEFENYIVAEKLLKVEHCLIGVPGASLSDLRTVYAHPQALMQSARFLSAYPAWEQVSMQNNAFAVRKIAADGDKTQAAIASAYAAKRYGMEVLREHINQSDSNSTRFIIVSSRKVYRRDARKISICFEVPHEAGSLYHILSHFYYNHLNMTKIESRPIEDRDWEYRFFLDFEGNLSDAGVRNALRALREETRRLRVLGNY